MANRFSAKTVGYAAAVKSLKRAADQGSRAHRKGVDAMTKAVFERSQYYCPVEYGDLKRNAYWQGEFGEETYRNKTQTTYVAYIVYPDWYAVYVHEVVSNYHEPPTSAKFISRAVDEMYPELNRISAEAYRNTLFVERSAI